MKIDFDPDQAARSCVNFRTAEGLTQTQMAERLRTTQGVVSALERGVVRSSRVAREALRLIPSDAGAVV